MSELFCSYYTQSCDFRNALQSVLDSNILKELNFHYMLADDFACKATNSLNNIDISLFHVNIRSLNKNHSELCVFLESLNFHFYVIVLSEIWNCNLQLYSSIFKNYNFHYNIPSDSKVGGIGVFVRDTIQCNELLSELLMLVHSELKIYGLS